MSFFKITESVQETANSIIDLINAHLDYYKIVAFDKIVTILYKSVSSAIVGFTAFMMAFFGSMALATFLGEMLTHPFLGYIIVSVLYGIGGAIFWKNRVNWVINPMIEAMSELVEETTHDLGLEDEPNVEEEFSMDENNDMKYGN